MVIRFFVKMMVDHQLVSVWLAYYLSIYFTIYLIFVTINDSHCTFWYIYGSHCIISINIYLYLQYFQQKISSFNKINGS